MPAGVVEGLHRTPARRAAVEALRDATVVADLGIDGDHHARSGSSRQVVLVPAEVLDDLDLKPGDLREQLCVRGLPSLTAGDVLEIGTARLEVVKPRVPCAVMDGVRRGLRAQLEGRAGWCTRVTAGGRVALGDPVRVSRLDDPDWLSDFRVALALYEAAPRADADAHRLREELAHLIERATHNGVGVSSPVPPGPDATLSRLYLLHDLATTAVVEAARLHGESAEPWVTALAAHYREHAATCL